MEQVRIILSAKITDRLPVYAMVCKNPLFQGSDYADDFCAYHGLYSFKLIIVMQKNLEENT